MIEVVKVKNRDEGNLKAREILKGIIDPNTLLVLSGGTSPDYLKMIPPSSFDELRTTERQVMETLPGAVCLGDERYGEPFHSDSNELLLKNSGLLDFLDLKNIEFHKILEGCGIEQTA